MVTDWKFLAAARSMAGPPTSICSMPSSRVTPSLATVCSNGYRFTTSRSIDGIEWASAWARWVSFPR